MAARLVDLESDLATVQDHRRDAGRAGLGVEQLRRLLAYAARAGWKVPALDKLPAFRSLVAAHAVRVGALLHLPFVHGGGLDAAPCLYQRLLDLAPFCADEELLVSLAVAVRLRHNNVGRSHHRLSGAEEQGDLIVQGDGERIFLDGGRVRIDDGHRRADIRGLPANRRGGASDPHRLRRDPVRFLHRHPVAAGESPVAVHEHAHAEAERLVERECLHVLEAYRDRLRLLMEHAYIGVVCALAAGGIESSQGEVTHGSPPDRRCIDCGSFGMIAALALRSTHTSGGSSTNANSSFVASSLRILGSNGG